MLAGGGAVLPGACSGLCHEEQPTRNMNRISTVFFIPVCYRWLKPKSINIAQLDCFIFQVMGAVTHEGNEPVSNKRMAD